MKTEITQAKYLALVGLLALAEHHNRVMEEIRRAAYDLLDLDINSNEGGHVDDAIWDANRRDAKKLLKRLDISVAKAEDSSDAENRD